MIKWIIKKIEQLKIDAVIHIIFDKNMDMRVRHDRIRWMMWNEHWTEELQKRWNKQVEYENSLMSRWNKK